MRKPTVEWLTVSGKFDFLFFKPVFFFPLCECLANPPFFSLFLQEDSKKRGSHGISQRGQLPCPGYRPALRYCPGCVLRRSWRIRTGLHSHQHLLRVKKTATNKPRNPYASISVTLHFVQLSWAHLCVPSWIFFHRVSVKCFKKKQTHHFISKVLFWSLRFFKENWPFSVSKDFICVYKCFRYQLLLCYLSPSVLPLFVLI